MLKCSFNYSEWCDRQATAIVSVMRDPRTSPEAAFFLVPRTESVEGRLVLSSDYLPGMPACIRLGDHRTWRTIPYSHVAQLVYNACRNEPIIPASSWSQAA